MPHRARLTVDLAALDRNFRTLSAVAAGAEVAPVVKADGYGLGAARVSRRLWESGARSFFVARLDEGEALRKDLGETRPARIFVLDGLVPGTAERVRRSDLIPILADPGQVEAARQAGPQLAVGLHVDTGMNRQGLSPDDLAGIARGGSAGLKPVLLMSHLGSATLPGDPRNALQLARFAGEWLGYGSGLRMARSTRIAVVAAGYADGLLRRGGGRAEAWFAGARRPVRIINMDLLAIEIGETPAKPGDRVELMGPNLPVDDLAAATDTVAHECLVRLSTRARRSYVRS